MKAILIALVIASAVGCTKESSAPVVDVKPPVVTEPAPTPTPPAPPAPAPEPAKSCTWQDDGTDDFGPCNPAPKPEGKCECGKKQGGYREVTNGTPSSCVIWKCL